MMYVKRFPWFSSGRRPIRTISLLLACSLALSACGASAGSGGEVGTPREDKDGPGKFADGSTMKMIQDRGKLVVGVNFNAPPFAYKDPNTGTAAGFDIEITKIIAQGIFGKNIEGKVDWVSLDARDRELALEENKVDLAIGRYAITVARKRLVDFAGPYYMAHQTFVTLQDDDEIQSISGLNGKKVCVVRGSTDVAAFKAAAPSADTSMILTTPAECGAQLSKKAVRAVAADHVDLIPMIKSAEGQLNVFSNVYGAEPYGVGVHKGTSDLRTYVNDRLEFAQDSWDDIYSRTVGDSESSATPPAIDRY